MGTGRENSFGALRLIFASLVILAHCPEILDGNRSREGLTQIFHTSMTFGSLAVDGFFLISGYLIAGSFMADRRGYFRRRVFRIYPAFIVCSLLCLYVVGPLAGGHLTHHLLGDTGRMLLLQMPLAYGAFAGRPYPFLNGSMWTIAYEFRCYILAAAFGVLGLYRNRWGFLTLTGAVLAAFAVASVPVVAARLPAAYGWSSAAFGDPIPGLRFTGIFMVGTCFKLFSDVRIGGRLALACALALIPVLFIDVLGEIALVTLGGVVLFWVALSLRSNWLHRLNAKDDISYGVYLYAWPATALLSWFWPGIPLALLIVSTLALSALLGALSWFWIEKPAQGYQRRLFQPA